MTDDLGPALDDLLGDLRHDPVLPAATARRVARRRGLKLSAGAGGGAGVLALALVAVLTIGTDDDRLVVPADRPTAPATAPVDPGPDAPPSAEATAEPSPEPSAPATPGPAPTAPPSAAATRTPEPAGPPAEVQVVLRPDGLGLTDGGSGSSSLPFGTDGAAVRAVVDRALGAGGERPTPDCGPGSSTVQHEGLFLLLQDGRFVGWVTGTPGLTTGDGLGVGSTLADLQASFGRLEVTEDTVGVEWSTGEGGLVGFLDGRAPTSSVTNMAAGVRCIAR
jgi:hypothetical protein